MRLLLLPLVGPFHLRYPHYNAVVVRDLVAAYAPDAIATTALPEDTLADPAWQETAELPLPLAVVPWARRRNVPVYGVGEPSPDPTAERDFRRYLLQYPQMRATLHEVDVALQPVEALLAEPLTLPRILEELVPALAAYQQLREERFGDGPGTDWLRQRTARMAERLRSLAIERLAVLVSVDHLPLLREALVQQTPKDEAVGDRIAGGDPTAPEVVLEPPPEITPSDEARARSLLDLAFRGDAPDPGNLIAQLRDLPDAEARYHEANLLLAGGRPDEALALLEEVVNGDFAEPYYLPGYLLARLGQLRDLAGRRDGALRAYRGVLALDYAPTEAREAARAGLERPFAVTEDTGGGRDRGE